MEGEGGDLMNILLPGQGSEDDRRRGVDGAAQISPTDYGSLEFSARMQSLGQNAGLQQGIPPIMSPSHGSSNYGAYQTQQPFPQSAGGSLMQHGELYQMRGQHSSSYFGGANYSGYGGGYPDQGSKQQVMVSSAGYQPSYEQPDSFGSASSLQNFGQFDAPPVSPSQHRSPMPIPSAMLPGMMHSGSSFSYGSIPRASTSSSLSQQMQMQASSFQGNLQHPPGSPSYSQMQMTSQGNMSVGSAGYPTYGGSARTQSSPVPQQSITLSSTFPAMSPPSPKQMHHPSRTMASPVLQQMQPMGSQNNHPLRSPGSGSQLSRRPAASPLAHPNSSPPPLTGLLQRSPTPVQQMYPSNVGGNTAAQQLSPQHSQYPPQSPLQQQLSCMYGWGVDVPAVAPLSSPTQLRYLQQQMIDGSFQNDEAPGTTQQTRPQNARSVIQPTGKLPSSVPRKPTVLSRKHSAGVTSPNVRSPAPKVPKLDSSHSPPKHGDNMAPNNFKSDKGNSPSNGSPKEPKEKLLLDKARQITPSASNGMSPSEIGADQFKGTESADESRVPIARDMAHTGDAVKWKSSDTTTVAEEEETKQTTASDQQKETVRPEGIGDALPVNSLQRRKTKNHAVESKDVSKTRSEEQLITTEEKTESLQDINTKNENTIHSTSHSKAVGKLEAQGDKETFHKAVAKQNISKQEAMCTQEPKHKPNKALSKSDGAPGEEDSSTKTKKVGKPHTVVKGARQKQVEPEVEGQFQEATQKPDVLDKSNIHLEKVKHSESRNKVETSKKVSKKIEIKEPLHKADKLKESAQPEKKENEISQSESVEKLEKPLVNDEKSHNSTTKTEDISQTASVDTLKEVKQVPKDKEESFDSQTETIKSGEKPNMQSATKSTVDVETETTPQVKLTKGSGVQSVVVTSVAGGTSALSGTTAITASVIAKGQAQGTGQQVLVAKTPTGQMYLIQGNVLIPVQNVQVQKEKGKHGSKVIIVNPASGSKHTTFRTTSTVTKLTTSTTTVDSQQYNKSPGKSKPRILFHSSDKKSHTVTTPPTHKKGPGDVRKGSSEKSRDKPSTISITSKERLKEKVVGNLDAKIKVIEQTGKQSESKVMNLPTDTSCKGSPTVSATGKRIGRPLGSKDKQKRKPYSHRKGSSEYVIESPSFVEAPSVVESTSVAEMSSQKSHRGRPRKSESEKVTPHKIVKRTLGSDVPTVGYSSEGIKKAKYSTPLPGIKFISVRPKGCAVGDPWCCCLCGKAPHHGYLGVLFGPYRAKLTSRETKDITSKASKSPTTKLLSPTSRSKQMNTEGSVAGTVNETEAPMLELWVHKDCVTWSHGVYMQGRSLEGLGQAVESAAQHKCTNCSQVGATLACFKRGCNQIFHFACAKESGCSFEEDNYTIFCAAHSSK